MRRGRTIIYLALILIIAIAGAAFYFLKLRPGGQQPAATPTPEVRYADVVIAGQTIYPGAPITEEMLSSMQLPADKVPPGLFTNKADVVGRYPKYLIAPNVPITDSMIAATIGNINLPGSYWASSIPQGLTAISIPITRLSSVAYGLRDGDYVNLIITMLVVDIDPAYQSLLPNYTASVYAAGSSSQGVSLAAIIQSGGEGSKVGRAQTDEALGQSLYLVPSELQRPRMVSQMIMQNIQVLHVGTFSDQMATTAPPEGTATPTPAPVSRPDIVTLMVTPQDAVMIAYLLYSKAEITLTLRNPSDQVVASQPEAATLEYLLTQYNIPIPAKLPYSLEPRLDFLKAPTLSNDVTTSP